MPPFLRILRLNWLRYAAAVKTLPELADSRSRIRFLRHVIRNCSFTRLAVPTHVTEPLVPLRVKELGGGSVYCRSGLSDLGVLYDTFVGRYHLPPDDLHPIESILDLGSNVGFTIAHYAVCHPQARILGVELDGQNCQVCRKNIEAFAGRCTVVHGAVWHEPGEVTYGGGRESGYAVIAGSAATPKSRVRSITVGTLIDQLNVPRVDFVKMDIEGAEREVLGSAGAWIRRVRCLKVEVHPEKASGPYTLDTCLQDLASWGMVCAVDSRHHACVIARWPE